MLFRQLTRLNLGKNQLDEIPTDAFHPLVNLEILVLNENKIKHISQVAFLGKLNVKAKSRNIEINFLIWARVILLLKIGGVALNNLFVYNVLNYRSTQTRYVAIRK